jgi:phospholipid/cholesterol/gamma-HCH transport system substrate-binding protein
MKHNPVETLVGAAVLVIAALFLVTAYQSSGVAQSPGTFYKAAFERVDGLVVGAEVRVSGVKVGTVKTLSIDPKTFQADVLFSVVNTVPLPTDTSAAIVGDGLMGGKYLSLTPGGDEENLKAGDSIMHTQSSVSLESMIGQLIFSNKQSSSPDSQEAHPSPKPAEPTSPHP